MAEKPLPHEHLVQQTIYFASQLRDTFGRYGRVATRFAAAPQHQLDVPRAVAA